jgi:hypothetical protein|nr:MAG TPA: hypothetical protein [Caudoviricetes sp.]
MIDVENQIYTPIAQALREAFPGINVSGEYVRTPSSFPHVSIVEQDNYPTTEHLSTSDTEQFVTLMYEINIYSNKTTGKKAQCRNIMKVIDDLMYRRNFIRTAMSPVPNLENATIYRIVARYQAETDGTNLYRR